MPSWFNIPSGTMTAAVLTSPGANPPSTCFTTDPSYPKPTPPSVDWILVRVKAAGLNRAELRGRANETPAPPEFSIFADEYHEEPPKILGEEFVGLVEEADSRTCFYKGQKVTGFICGGGKAHDGAYAEFVICHRRRLFHLPGNTNLLWEVLGAIPMSMWTAYGSLFEAAQCVKGNSVLVHGGTSSVGIWAILLAKEKGCTVIATTRQEGKVEKLKKSGADHVLLEERLKEELVKLYPDGVDVILELIGPDKVTSFAFANLAIHGTVVCTGVLGKQWTIKEFSPFVIPPTRKLTFYTLGNRGRGDEDVGVEVVERVLEEVVRKVEDGTFRKEVFLDRVFQLEEVGKAHEYMEESGAVGKGVVTVP